MKKYLLGIILFVVGIVLMGAGLFMQFTMTPSNSGSDTGSGAAPADGTGSELQDISTFDFSSVTNAILSGQVGGYLVACNEDVILPVKVSDISMSNVLNNVNAAKGYRVSDKTMSSCAETSLVVGVLSATSMNFDTRMLEVEPYDENTVLLSYDGKIYEFVFDVDVSTLFSNLA